MITVYQQLLNPLLSKRHADAEVDGEAVFLVVLVLVGVPGEIQAGRADRQQILDAGAQAGPEISEKIMDRTVNDILVVGKGAVLILFRRQIRGNIAVIHEQGGGQAVGQQSPQLNAEHIKGQAAQRIAAVAPSVLRRAAQGDRRALPFVISSQEILAALACCVAEDLRLSPPVPVSWAGSLMENRAFRAGVLRSLRRQGLRARAVAPAQPPVEAAHALAARLARGEKG